MDDNLIAVGASSSAPSGSAPDRTPTGNMSPGPSALAITALGVVIACVKYVVFVMRVDNDGEGGILALMSLLGVKQAQRPLIVAVGLFGAALIYGDGAITPAISVLSALEGLELAPSSIAPYVLPMTVVVLLALFAMQPLGTARIGRLFGPCVPRCSADGLPGSRSWPSPLC
jgi:KUP system potassium uptake protein